MLYFYEKNTLIVIGFVTASKVSLITILTFTSYYITKPTLYVIKPKEGCLVSLHDPLLQYRHTKVIFFSTI